MSALKKQELLKNQETLGRVTEDDILSMHEFLESLESKIRESSLVSLKRRIHKKKESQKIRGKRISTKTPEQVFLFQ